MSEKDFVFAMSDGLPLTSKNKIPPPAGSLFLPGFRLESAVHAEFFKQMNH